MPSSELQVFLIWNKARFLQDKILEDIQNKYNILQVFEIDWPRKSFSDNMTRFYSKNLRSGFRKASECGRAKFLFIIAIDSSPENVYNNKKGIILNIKAIQNKGLYREWTGGGFLVHGSDNEEEAEENILFILGQNKEEILKSYNTHWDGKIKQISCDMPGRKSWESQESFLNFCQKIKEVKQSLIQDDIITIWTMNPAKTKRLLNLRKPLICFSKEKLFTKIENKRYRVLLCTSN